MPMVVNIMTPDWTMTFTVSCKIIHPPWCLSCFLTLQAGNKMVLVVVVSTLLFTQHAYHFKDRKYFLQAVIKIKTEILSVHRYSLPLP